MSLRHSAVRVVGLIVQDARVGFRSLLKSPAFAAAAIGTLALGIGANTAIFSVVYATLLAPLPYPDPDRLVMVWSRSQTIDRMPSTTGDFLDWKRDSPVFRDLHAWSWHAMSLGTGETPARLAVQTATPGFLTTIGHPILMGRDFLPQEGVAGNDRVVILTHRIWQSRFGDHRDIVGRQVRLDGMLHTVVGVLAAGAADRVQPDDGGLYLDVYLPLVFTPEQQNYDARWLRVMGRLTPGVSLAQANAALQAQVQRMADVRPPSTKGWSAVVEPFTHKFLTDNTRAVLWLMLGAVGFVLLIACANVANLLLARGTARRREVAVRTALGASRGRIFTQFLGESLVLAIVGGAAGVLLAWTLVRAIMAVMPPFTLPAETEIALNLPVLLFTLGLSLLAGVLFGCVPAWQATRATFHDALKEAGRAAVGAGRDRLRRACVVAEVALALTLLSGGGLAISSVMKLTRVDLGFQSDRLLTFVLPVPTERLPQAERITTFYQRLLEQVRAVPGVVSASTSTGMPVWGFLVGQQFSIAGQPVADPAQRDAAGFNSVTPDYYRTFGITMTRGRAFTERDTAASLPVAIVSEAFVQRYLPNVDPLTQRVVVEQVIPGVQKLGPPIAWQIVGVHREVRNGGPRLGTFPEIEVPFAQSPRQASIVAIRTAGDPESIQKSVAAIVQSMDPDLPMTDVRTMEQLVDFSLNSDRFQALLFASFAGLALVLAAVGIYGVLSFTVAQRTHEIGLRMALGARRGQVLWHVLRQGLLTVLVGLVLGTIGAYVAGRALRGLWFDVGAIDPLAFTIVVCLLLVSAMLACLVPARRAASLNPLAALRDE